jgi:hypothetical protein
MRCAVVEFTIAHGETLPTFVYLLNRLGIEVDVYARSQILDSDPFAHCPGLRFSLHSLDSRLIRANLRLRGFRAYDFVIANSIEPTWTLQRLSGSGVPIMGAVHNAILLLEDQRYRSFFSHRKRQALVLARHVARYVGDGLPLSWIAPVYLMDKPLEVDISLSRFCLQGTIDFRRRNYEALVEAVGQVVSEGRTDLEIEIIGRPYALDGLRLERTVRSRGLQRFIKFRTDVSHYRDYLIAVASCGYSLPLVDRTSLMFEPYFLDKITSSISMAIGVGTIPLVHSELGQLYDLGSLAISYLDGGLSHAISTALDLPTPTRQQMVQSLQTIRAQLIDASLLNLERALGELGLRPPTPAT